MIRSARVVRRRRLSLALSTSALAWGLALPQAAQAQCAPDPTLTDGMTTCTGTDTDGIRVTTPGTTLSVAGGATVANGGAPAITVEVPNMAPFVAETITVAGQVNGGTQSGITLLTGANATYYGSTTSLALTVAAGASVTGSTALAVGQTAGSLYGELLVRIDNSGSLSGSDGVALRGDLVAVNSGYTSSSSAFGAIANSASGVVSGSVLGPVASLANAGLIDGGSGSALAPGAAGTAFPFTISPGAWTNSGTIRSNSAAATIVSSTIDTFANSGTIANAGNGAALSSSYLVIQNQAGGQISSGGTTAVAGTNYVNLVNRGTITGDVTAGNSGSVVGSAQGRINGSVTFGSGNDTLLVGYDGTPALVTGVTGTIDAGGGINTEQLAIGSGTTIATPVMLLSGFQQLAISTDPDVTTTLGTGFVAPGSIELLGAGTLVNRAVVVTADTAFRVDGVSYPAGQRLINEGSIQTTSTTAFAVIAGSYAQIVNNGSIVSSGGGVNANQAALVNNGSITAAATGVTMFDNGVTNSGTIRSTGGTAVSLSGNVGTLSTNSGIIQGAAVGVELSAYLMNTGSVTATNTGGTAVQLDPYGVLFNNPGGVIGSGGQAVTGSSFNESIVNAGTINGTVSLTSPSSNHGSQRYISQAGGVLNGDLVLGPDGLLFTDLTSTGSGKFAGIAGTVTAASGAMLRLRVSGAQAATIGPVGPFSTATYELVDGASLALSGSGTVTRQVMLAGTGTVDLTANLSTVTTSPALATVSTLATQAGYGDASGALTITSHGTIAVSRERGSTNYAGTGISLGGGDTLINDGTISVTDRNPVDTGRTVGVSGGSVTNNGRILLDGGIGVASNLVNTGSIIQIDGGAAAIGVAGGMVDNSGTIRVGGTAVTASNGNGITNSGTIASTGGIAITGTDTSASATIINTAGAAISGTGGTAVRLSYGTFINAGAVIGTVDMGYGFPYYDGAPVRSYGASTFVAAGGTISGDLLFGDGPDVLLQTGSTIGVSGMVDGGGGADIFGRSLTSSGTVSINPAAIRNFEDGLVQALGAGTVVTTTASGRFGGNLYLAGNASVVNQADIAGMLTTSLPYDLANPFSTNPLFPSDQMLSSIVNAGAVAGGVTATTASFTNTGTILRSATTGPYPAAAVALFALGTLSIGNSGRIDGGLSAILDQAADGSANMLTFDNSGSTAAGNGAAADLQLVGQTGGGTISITNTGTLSSRFDAASARGLATGLQLVGQAAGPFSYAITNSGTVAVTSSPEQAGFGEALRVSGSGLSGTITNAAGGTISASGGSAYGIVINGHALNLVNAGTIVATGTTASVAIYAADTFADSIRNDGSITGSIRLGDGNDRIENFGAIAGDVFLAGGDDTFVQSARGSMVGTVDGGAGTDSLIVDAIGGGSIDGSRFVNFERVSQTGSGVVGYSGAFAVDTIHLDGGGLTVASGERLSTAGPVTITGGDGVEAIRNFGTIGGGIDLGGGNDSVDNRGRIDGNVRLGAGDDSYTEGPGSSVGGTVDGGAGSDSYVVALAGDRNGIGARTGFERLAVTGAGLLGLTLDQSFDAISVAGTGIDLHLAGFTTGRIDGSDAAEQVTIDGDVPQIALGGGDDVLRIAAGILAGNYDGGSGNDRLALTGPSAVTLSGTAAGFETVALAGGALTVAGTLGAPGQTIGFGGGAQMLTLASGGRLLGTVDLGDGDDGFRLAWGGRLGAIVSGGAGIDAVTIETPGDLSLAGESLRDFETLTTIGGGTLTLASGDSAYARIDAGGGLTVAAGATLSATQVQFGSGDNRFVIAGGFAGSADGGGGNDALLLSGGSAAAPVAFRNLAGFGSFVQSGGFATIAGTAQFSRIDLTGGRLIGLAGSSIAAPQINVGTGATFGSAGSVAGNIAVAGTLSPGASPGTMSVTGNVGLAAGSTSLFELTPTVSDKLLVSGTLAIANGATLTLVGSRPLTPGAALDLIVANGGITGTFTTVNQPATIFGFLRQSADRIQLFGQFDATGFNPQVTATVNYVNGLLTGGKAGAALIAAVPTLLTNGNATNGAAFARLNPEAYASATQISIENGLTLAKAARSGTAAAGGGDAGAFTFAQGIGNWRPLDGSAARGTSRASTNSYGVLGGVGFGSAAASVAGFVGYLDSHQRIAALGVRTESDGIVAGLIGHAAAGGFDVSALLAYDGGKADTRRALPGELTATGRYHLHGWVSDTSVGYALPLGTGWSLKPAAGLTYIATRRGSAAEKGGGAFSLDVAGRRSHATIADGTLTLRGGEAAGAMFHPWAWAGIRHQLNGRATLATASFAGTDGGFSVPGVARTATLATAGAGASVTLTQGIELFAAYQGEFGSDGTGTNVNGGLRLRF